MPLDELHARRLATVIGVFEDALDRIELVLRGLQEGTEARGEPQPEPGQIGDLRVSAERIRARLGAAAERFEVRRTRPHWRQKLAAELSTLWVVIENAKPRRMKGYGRDFAPQDRADWEALVRDLLGEIESMRQTVTAQDSR
jgi:hypothetical protein